MEPLPDLATLSDPDLKKLIADLTREEHEVSYQRRLLHGKIDILRAELVARLQKTEGKSVLDDVDVEHLTAILTSRPHRPSRVCQHLLPGVRLPEPGSRELLLPAARSRARKRRNGGDADLHGGGGRGCVADALEDLGITGRRSSFARAAAGRGDVPPRG